ncbi:MAG: hypothetical protein LQ352_007462, partial [Teloschistes flavicans]
MVLKDIKSHSKTAKEPQSQQQKPKKAKKKKEPGQQPAWMFPAKETNPVSEEELRKEKEEWDAAIKFLKYRIHSTPVKAAPPKQLLTLIGAFLTSYGFNTTCRIYQLQCDARSKLDGWDSVLEETSPKGFPDLVTIYNDWAKTYGGDTQLVHSRKAKQEKKAANKEKRLAAKAKKADEEATSSSGDSSDGSQSDAEMADLEDTRQSVSSSSSISSSDSDADDESDKAGLGASARKPTASDSASKLKRKGSSSASSSSASSSEEEEPAPKKARKLEKAPANAIEPIQPASKEVVAPAQDPTSSASSSSSSSDSDSEVSSSNSETEKKNSKPTTTAKEASPTHPPTKAALSDDSDSDSSSDSEDNEFPVPKIDRSELKPQSKPSSESSATL